MAEKDYILQIGIDAEKLINPLNDTIAILTKVEKLAQNAGKDMAAAFQEGRKPLEEVNALMKPTQKELENLRIISQKMGKDMATAFSGRDVDTTKMQQVKKIVDEIHGSASKKIKIDADADSLKIYRRQIKETEKGVKELEQATQGARRVLSGMDAGSKAYKDLEQATNKAEQATQEFSTAVKGSVGTHKSLRQELRAVQDEMQRLEMAGKSNSARFQELSQRAGSLRDQIEDTNAQIKILSSDTAKFDALISGATGLVGAFTAAQGAIALFGSENKELEQSMKKVMGAMAILQGLQAIANTLNKDSAFSVIFLRKAKKADAEATQMQTAATTAKMHAMKGAEAADKSATIAAKANAAAQKLQSAAMKGAAISSRILSTALKALGIGLVLSAITALVEYWDKLKVGMAQILPAGLSVGKLFDNLKAYAMGLGNAVVQYVITPFKAAYKVLTADFAGAWEDIKKGYSIVSNFKEGKLKQEARNEQKYREEAEQAEIDAHRRQLERLKNRGQDTYAQEQALRKRELQLKKDNQEEAKKIQEAIEDAEDQHFLNQERKAQEQAKKARERKEAEAKKAAEEAKRQADLALKYEEQIHKLRINNIADLYERERATIIEEGKQRIQEIEKEGARTIEATQKQKELIIAINQEVQDKLVALEQKHTDEKIKLRLEGAKMLQSLAQDSKDKALALLELENQEAVTMIKEKFNQAQDLKDALLQQQAQQYEQKAKDLRLKYAQQELKDEEERGALMIELAANQGKQTQEQEEQKQLALLNLKHEYAKEHLKVLEEAGKNETDIEVLKAKKLVQDTRNAMQAEAEKGKKFELFKLMGLDVSKEHRAALADAGRAMIDNLQNLTSYVIDSYQAQINKRQEVIDQIDKDIEKTEARLDKEKELREKGYANNVEILEEEIEAKKQAKAREIEIQEEAQKKQLRIQKIQMAADTLLQGVNLITASTKIFSSLAGIPFVGVPLAIGLIAAMFASFALARAKAYQAVNAGVTKMAKGGLIDGYSHEKGGKKYYANTGEVKELEAGEYVVRKSQAKKYSKLLHAINTGNFTSVTFQDLQTSGLFKNLGINLNNVDVKTPLKERKEVVQMESHINVNVDDKNYKNIEAISHDLRYLAHAERTRSQSWEDPNYYYFRTGTKIVKLRK